MKTVKCCWLCVAVSIVFTWVELTGILDLFLSSNPKVLIANDIIRHEITKYILVWSTYDFDPILNAGLNQELFVEKNCTYTNCYMTRNRSILYDVTKYDMIIFHGPEIVLQSDTADYPKTRLGHQIYVFNSMESPVYYPSCLQIFNNFFNWTWTHKLKSDIPLSYMTVKDKAGNVVGPKKDINWEKVESMEPIDEILKVKLDGKDRAAAWFVSNCGAKNNRRQVASDIKEELEKYGYTLDVYGRCGWMSCEWDSIEDCEKLIEKHYYFYLSFENSNSEDYVTEKLLRALKYYAIPVVYGGANYSRYLPDGIYLNARKLDAEDLVKQMVYLMRNKEQYYNYFRWHNHYSYHTPPEFPETHPLCNLCTAINNVENFTKVDYGRFDVWWNEPNACR